MIDLTTLKTDQQQINFDIFNLVLRAIPAEWSKTISSLACVQKAWKDPAQALLFHSVVFTNLTTIHRFISAIIRHLGPENHWRSVITLNVRVKHITLAPGVKLGVRTPTALNMISNILPVLEDLRSIAYDIRLFDPLDFRMSIIPRWSRVIPPTVTTISLAVRILIIWVNLDN